MSVSALITIKSHSVRNLASLDKSVSFTAECVEEEEFKIKFAQYLANIPSGSTIKASFELVED